MRRDWPFAVLSNRSFWPSLWRIGVAKSLSPCQTPFGWSRHMSHNIVTVKNSSSGEINHWLLLHKLPEVVENKKYYICINIYKLTSRFFTTHQISNSRIRLPLFNLNRIEYRRGIETHWEVKICSPSPAMVKTRYGWKILEWDDKLQTNKQKQFWRSFLKQEAHRP